MRIVVDTSVFVSTILGRAGPSREIIRRCLLKEQYRPLMGAALLAEYESLLARPGKLDDCKLAPAERKELLDALLSVCEWVHIYYLWRPNLPDEADNYVMELAISGTARYVVTNNVRDFRRSELHFPELEIVTPEALLRS